MTERIGFSGTQRGMAAPQLATVHRLLTREWGGEFHHGDCIGADAEAHECARAGGKRIIGHPPTDSTKRAFTDCDEWREAKPYLDSNEDVVDETDRMLFAPRTQTMELRSGTWATVRYAERMGKGYIIVYPNGMIKLRPA